MEGKIYINGTIGNTVNETGEEVPGVEVQHIISQVSKQPHASSFDCYINSPGGNVEIGFQIYNYLKTLPVPLNTIGSGMVASMATVIFMAGEKRSLTESAQFMIHMPSVNAERATADDLVEIAKIMKAVESRMTKFYSTNTNLAHDALTPLLKNETFLTRDELYNMGFITEKGAMKMVAKLDIDFKIKKQPMETALNKKDRGLIQSLIASAKLIISGPVSKLIKLADDRELDFYELKDDGEPAVGDKARIDGKEAEGPFVMADGQTFNFEMGELKTIDAAEGDDDDDEMTEEEMKAMKAENEKLKGEKAALVTSETEAKEKVKTLEAEAVEKDAVIAQVVKLESKFGGKLFGKVKPGKGNRKREDAPSGFGAGMEYIQEQKKG